MSTRPDGASLFLSEPQRALLGMVLDRIIPREGELPGAGELGVAGHIDGVVGKSRELRRLFAGGLASIEITGSEMFSSEFAALSGQERVAVLRRVESEHAEFFQALVLHTYAGYYTSPTVTRLLGLEGRPPQPLGYELEPFDPGLLENVKKRGKLYRDA